MTRHGTPVARLVPIEALEPVSLVGSMVDSVLLYVGPFDPVPGTWALDTQDE